jgi:hypothetical protein
MPLAQNERAVGREGQRADRIRVAAHRQRAAGEDQRVAGIQRAAASSGGCRAATVTGPAWVLVPERLAVPAPALTIGMLV